jgi:hypothetical protein
VVLIGGVDLDSRAAMVVVSVASAMVRVADGATEPVREVCRGEERREGDFPPSPCPSTVQPRTASSLPSSSA